jgi:FtsP/CotA-like multicopper oxidase with cupredoxin domain
MSADTRPISRRRLLAGAVAAACFNLPDRLKAEIASTSPRILRAQAGAVHLRGQIPSTALGYDGTRPGPTLRVRHGGELRVRLVNELAEPTAIHWHGVRVPNAMDGVIGLTQPPVTPGASFDYRFRPPDAGTFWYHAHAAGQTDRGLYGALIVEEAQGPDVDRDVVLLFGMPMIPGDTNLPVMVNGTAGPDIAVRTGERLRLRLINATTTRGVALRFDDHPAWLVAVDGQPSEPFLAGNGRVALGPGSRIDLIMDARHNSGASYPILASGRDEVSIARLVYAKDGNAAAAVRVAPGPLPANPLPARIDLRTALRLDLTLGDTKTLDVTARPLFAARRGRAVALVLRNPSAHPHVVHLHGHAFRHLDRLDDGWKPYWRWRHRAHRFRGRQSRQMADHIADARPPRCRGTALFHGDMIQR